MSHAPTPALMKPEKVIAILEELLLEAQTNSASWHRLAPEAKAWAQNVRGALVHGFGQKNAQLDSFNSEWESWFMVKGDSPSELRQSFVERFPAVLGALQSAIRQLRWQLDDSSQVFQPAGSQHDSFVEIRKMVVAATTELLIVDSYVDHTLWELLSNVGGSVKIRILTDQMKGDFKLEAKKFAAQHGNAVEVRTASNYHDRFIIVDDGSRCWHLGVSIKDAGNKAWMSSEIEDSSIRNAVKGAVESAWASATTVPL